MKLLIHTSFILCCLYSLPGHSQLSDSLSLRQRYENETIYLQGKHYIKGGQPTRFSYISIEKEFTFSREAYSEFLLSAKDHASARKSNYLALGLYVGSILVLVNDQKGSAFIPLAGSLVAYGYGLHYRIRSGNRFQHALWVRNRDVLLEGSPDSTALRSRYENETIHLERGRHVKGNQVISSRHKAFDKEFVFSIDGLEELKRSRQEYKKALPFSLLGLGLVVSSFVFSTHHEQTASYIALGGALVTISISNHFQYKSLIRLRKAIWLRNRDVLLKN